MPPLATKVQGNMGTVASITYTVVCAGRDQVWPNPSLAKSGYQVWPNQVWPRPSLARPSAGQYSPCLCETVAGRRPATPSHKYSLCPLFVSTGLHVEHCRPKAGNAPHEGLLKLKGGGFGVLGFRGLGCRSLGFRSLGFRV